MHSVEERRSSERCSCRGSVRIALLHHDQSRFARLTDFSEDGLGLQSTVELKRGCYLLVRLESIRPDAPDKLREANLPSVGIGEVKWCRSGNDAVDTTFAAGIKFLLPGYSV